MFLDGLEDHYEGDTKGRLMDTFAEDCARHCNFSREAQDVFATTSTLRAHAAHRAGHFAWEMVFPRSRVTGPSRRPIRVRLRTVPQLWC
jgi:acetyl-CoA C-acetyltransferase